MFDVPEALHHDHHLVCSILRPLAILHCVRFKLAAGHTIPRPLIVTLNSRSHFLHTHNNRSNERMGSRSFPPKSDQTPLQRENLVVATVELERRKDEGVDYTIKFWQGYY